MSYGVEFKPEATIELQALTSMIQERILRKVYWLSENFENVIPQALSADLSGLFKLRIGDYRVIYSFDAEAQLNKSQGWTSPRYLQLAIVPSQPTIDR